MPTQPCDSLTHRRVGWGLSFLPLSLLHFYIFHSCFCSIMFFPRLLMQWEWFCACLCVVHLITECCTLPLPHVTLRFWVRQDIYSPLYLGELRLAKSPFIMYHNRLNYIDPCVFMACVLLLWDVSQIPIIHLTLASNKTPWPRHR